MKINQLGAMLARFSQEFCPVFLSTIQVGDRVGLIETILGVGSVSELSTDGDNDEI